MIRRPKPKQNEETGEYLPNGACAKAGLNKSIADAGWGRFFEFLHYKAMALCKQVIPVPPHYTSQIGLPIPENIPGRVTRVKRGGQLDNALIITLLLAH